jgi:ribonuclease HII
MKHAATWEWELNRLEQGDTVIIGIDEVGRGAWAGPLVACAYAFSKIPTSIDLFDSKLIAEPVRNKLAEALRDLGHYGIGEVSPHEIDTIGLQAGQYLAYERALEKIALTPHSILLDGRPWYSCRFPHEAVVGGDKKIASISAASILAKVYRDTYMKSVIHDTYPNYGFNVHVGYGTRLHQQALKQYGVLPIHRRSYKPIQALIKIEVEGRNSKDLY